MLESLASGTWVSGAALAAEMGITRAGLWKQVEQLRGQGVDIEALPGRGYRLPAAVDLLAPRAIWRSLSPETREVPVEVAFQVDSTNSRLLAEAAAGTQRKLLVAELQASGRGRWGRPWSHGFGGGLAMSLLWTFEALPNGLSGLSLACAIAVAEALRSRGADRVGLKWPNDLLVEERKLGGFLVELVGDPAGRCSAVLGLGLNLHLTDAARARISQPAAALDEYVGGAALRRNEFAGVIATALIRACRRFQAEGFAPFLSEWEQFDVLRGRSVVLQLPEGTSAGVAAGIDAAGALRLRQSGGTATYYSGDVQLKVRRGPPA